MPGYKDTLLKHLSEAGWEQAEAFETTQWWATEVWRMRSTTTNWGFELFLSFIVDPDPGDWDVWLVDATIDDPCEGERPRALATIRTKQKNLVADMPDFLKELDGLRRGNREENKEAEQGAGGQAG